ncbi:MAG: hypothetical protein JW929_16475 [Anaerolineales bacterium]|nr:hypothetical protein [Anaerolineales bacterium]
MHTRNSRSAIIYKIGMMFFILFVPSCVAGDLFSQELTPSPTSTQTQTETFTPTITETKLPTSTQTKPPPPQKLFICYHNNKTELSLNCLSSREDTYVFIYFNKGTTLEYEFVLNGDIHGFIYIFRLYIGVDACFTEGTFPEFIAQILIEQNNQEKVIAEVSFYTLCAKPRFLEESTQGKDPNTKAGDKLIFRVKNNSNYNVPGIFQTGNKANIASYLLIPAIY